MSFWLTRTIDCSLCGSHSSSKRSRKDGHKIPPSISIKAHYGPLSFGMLTAAPTRNLLNIPETKSEGLEYGRPRAKRLGKKKSARSTTGHSILAVSRGFQSQFRYCFMV